MSSKTSIEWAANLDGTPGATWNPIRALRRIDGVDQAPATHMTGTHCVRVSDGCRHCYAERFNMRGLPGAGTGLPYTKQSEAKITIYLDERMLLTPLRRRKPCVWFLSSMTDVFADFVTDEMLDRLFAVMALTPQHRFIALTKRAARMRAYFGAPGVARRVARAVQWLESEALARLRDNPIDPMFPTGRIRPDEILASDAWAVQRNLCEGHPNPPWPLPNVVAGVSVEDQPTADERIAQLLATPAACRVLSIEPLLGPMEVSWALSRNRLDIASGLQHRARIAIPAGELRPIDWIIAGGESGPDARPMHPDWARSLRDQCAKTDAEFFFKQWGEWTPGVNVERTAGVVSTATWFAEKWIPGSEDLARDDGHIDDEPDLYRVGKAHAGRRLDGVEHNGRPAILQAGGRKAEGELATRRQPSAGRSAS